MLKKRLEDYRQGGIGALLDEYERAVNELKSVLQNIGEADYTRIADSETDNEDCRSIQTIMSHVVSSGYDYANIIREQFSVKPELFENKQIDCREISKEIDKMLDFTVETLDGNWELSNAEIDKLVTIMPWGTPYNLEQILEHAIAHVLRHRRQIEKFLLKFQI